MSNPERIDAINFRCHPYRGLLQEVADELGCSRPSVTQKMNARNPKVCALILSKIEDRERAVRRFEAKVEGVAL